MDRLKTMESFVRVVKAGSFAAAADQLGMSRAIVTKHVIELENRLGARLLNRSTRKLSFTEAGAEYYEFCLSILNQLADEELSIARLQKEPQGSLRILAPKSFGSLHFANAMAEFSLAYPHINLSLTLDDSSSRTFDFAQQDFDVAIRLTPVADSAIMARKIGTLRWVACVSPAYLERKGEPSMPEGLATHNCLIHPKLAPDGLWHFGLGETGRAVKVRGNFSSNSVVVLRRAVLAGVGIALLPFYRVAPDLVAGTLRQVLPDFPLPERPLYVLFPDNRLVSRKIRLFIDFLADWYKAHQADFV